MAALTTRSLLLRCAGLSRYRDYRPLPIVYHHFQTSVKINPNNMVDHVIIEMKPLSRSVSTTSIDRFRAKDDEDNSKTNKQPDLEAKIIEKPSLKELIKNYGFSALFVHISSSLCFLGITWICVRFFIRPEHLAQLMLTHNILIKHVELISSGSTTCIAYAIYKVLMPLRLAFTVWATPKFVQFLIARGLIKK